MPLEVIDARSTTDPSEVVRAHGGWERPDLNKARQEVQRILEEVREQGDEAVCRMQKAVYGADTTPAGLRVSPLERDNAAARVEGSVVRALEQAAANIRAFHEAQRPQDWSIDRDGAMVGQVFRAVRRVGIHAPAGAAPLPSSVLMTVIPAQVAGVSEIALCCPASAEAGPPDVMLAAAKLCGVTEIYRIGGAHAIAALAYGTEAIAPCDMVCGPGGLYTTLAKRELYGTVGIEGLFGPSESVVVADGSARPAFAAAELLTQAEHGTGDEAAILVTTSEAFLGDCLFEVEERLRKLGNAGVIRDALASHGLAVLVRDLDQAAEIVDTLAPEHLCIQVEDPHAFLAKVRFAGTALIGGGTPATMSDYCAGPSHVLPTARAARYSSGLGVRDFMVSINTVEYSRQALFRDAPIADTLAQAEGMPAHRESVLARLEET